MKLKELVHIIGGGTPSRDNEVYWNGDIPWVTVKDMNREYIASSMEYISEEGLNNSSTKLIEKNSILIPTRMGLGRVAINKVDVAINQDLKALIPKDTEVVELDYLFYFLKSKSDYLISQGKGATVKGITLDILRELDVPLPSLEIQKKIAEALNIASKLVQKRQDQIMSFNELTQSLFLEMFGDPAFNNRWAESSLEDITIKITDGEHINPQFLNQGSYIIKAKDVLTTGISLKSPSYISNEDLMKFRKKCNPELGDLLLVSRGATIGRTSIVNIDIPFALMGSVILIKPIPEKLNNYFLVNLFKNAFIKSKLLTTSSATAQQAIYLKDLKKLKIIVPPIELQNNFASKVAEIEKQSKVFKESLVNIETLYKAILQKAFKGELFQD